jgi:hypothetical protein
VVLAVDVLAAAVVEGASADEEVAVDLAVETGFNTVKLDVPDEIEPINMVDSSLAQNQRA